MADAAQLDISPEHVSSQAAKCQEGSTSGQIHEIVSERQCNEPTKDNIGCDIVENELREICKAYNIADEQLQPFTDNSRLEQLGLPPEVVSKSCQSGAGNVFTKPSVQQHHFSSEHIQDKPLQTTTAMSACTTHYQLHSGNVTKESLTEQLEMAHEDPGVNDKNVKISCAERMSLEQTNDSCFGTSSGEPAEEKNPSGLDFLQNELLQTIIPVSICSGNGQLQSISENMNIASPKEQEGLPPEDLSKTCQTGKISSFHQTTLQQINEFGSGSVPSEPAQQKDQLDSEPAQVDEVKTSEAVSRSIVWEQSRTSNEAMTKDSQIRHLEPPLEDASKNPIDKEMEPLPEDATQNSSLEQSDTPSKNASKDFSLLDPNNQQNPKPRKRKYTSRSSVSSDRVLRSRTGEKPKDSQLSNNVATLESNNSVANVSNGEEKKRKKKEKRHRNRVVADEFSRIRRHLRYLLNRINYEKSLIDAYSGEGWKGSSLEKLKPEKELQRATSEILRRKLKIRDLFQRLDSLCAEGMFPESLYDSDGQIDSEDIYCAKCGSKDVSLDNDIILCDGACDRGFHQFCLEPPLFSQDIPPDDEGWLCPGCDCKVDCFDLLNDSEGIDLSVTDNWEKVFPEAAVAASAGQNQDPNFGLPSDDSDDNDYDPNGPETDDKVQEEESSSDEFESESESESESEYASASDGLETPKINNEQYLGLPSDDSEDDDYNPDAPDIVGDVKHESSSSDFTSDSEDLGAALGDNIMSSEGVEGPKSMPLDDSRPLRGSGKQSTGRGRKKNPLKDELSSLLKLAPELGGSASVSGKRHVERLDYKKLHDETYGNVPTDSSDEEEWSDTATQRTRKKGTGQVASRSPNENTSNIKDELITNDMKPDLDKNENTPSRTPHRKSKVEDTSNLSNKSLKGSPMSGSTSERAGSSRSAYKRLGEAVTQRLAISFKENHYPDRSMKESLARELGLMAKQVSKWFENARHCLKLGVDKGASENCTPLPQTNREQHEQADTIFGNSDHSGDQNKLPRTDDPMHTEDVKDDKLATPQSSKQKSITPNNRKRKCRSEDLDPKIETPKPPAQPETSRKGSRVTTRRRKSVA